MANCKLIKRKAYASVNPLALKPSMALYLKKFISRAFRIKSHQL